MADHDVDPEDDDVDPELLKEIQLQFDAQKLDGVSSLPTSARTKPRGRCKSSSPKLALTVQTKRHGRSCATLGAATRSTRRVSQPGVGGPVTDVAGRVDRGVVDDPLLRAARRLTVNFLPAPGIEVFAHGCRPRPAVRR